jgi:hemerythrin-like domain-containing protein
VNVIRGFADDIHHAKEERILFPMMVKTGFSAEAGPIVVMLYEHFMGREFANCIASHLEKYKKREEGAVHEICANMLGYASLLKRHIFNENNIVFPTAAGIISENEQEQLLSAFRRAEQANEKHLSRDEYIAVIKNLAGLYP